MHAILLQVIEAFGLTSNPRKAQPPAVDDVSFEARAGHVTALLGPVGAGKTTTLRLMLELQQGRGTTYFRGRPLHRIAHPSREVGVLLGDVPGHPARSVRGHLRMLCAAAGVPVRRADEVLEVVGLVSFREERLGTLSRGMDRRLGLACTLLPDPHTLVLDEPTDGLSPREQRWMHGMLRAHARQGGTVLFTTADPKEAARTADRVVTLDGGRLLADQEGKEFARTRLRPRVAVRSPHAARLAALLAKEARTARRSVEVVREGGNRLSVYGSTTADIGEIAFRNGILVHQLADEVGDMGPASGTGTDEGPEAGAVPEAAGETVTAAEWPQRAKESAEVRPARAVPGPSAGQQRRDGQQRPPGRERPEERPAATTPPRATEPPPGPTKQATPVVPGPTTAEGPRAAASAAQAQERHTGAGQAAPGASPRTTAPTADASPGQSASQPGPPPSPTTRPEPEDDTLAVVLALCADEPGAEKTTRGPEASRAANAASVSDETAAGPRPRRHPSTNTGHGPGTESGRTAGTGTGHRPAIQPGHGAGTETGHRPGVRTGRTAGTETEHKAGTGTGHRPAIQPGHSADAETGHRPGTEPGRTVGTGAERHPGSPTRRPPGSEAGHRAAGTQALPSPGSSELPASPLRSPDARPQPDPRPQPADGPRPGSPRSEPSRPAQPAPRLDPPSALPPPISVRPAPSPLRPLRYELRRAGGIGTGFLACGAALVASALTAVLLARIGHTPQARLFAAWPRQLPLPPTALVAGLLGALAFGDEFRHPALAADRGTVPRRLGLLTAKLLVCGATALLLAFLTVGCDAEVLYLVYGREMTQVPTDWLSLTAAWFGLVLGCSWAGVLAAGVFRSTTAGLAAVLAVPVVVVPLVQTVLHGSSVRDAAGFSLRVREVLLSQWPFGGERYLAGLVRIVAQPVGGAMALSLAALLCAYLFTTLRARAR